MVKDQKSGSPKGLPHWCGAFITKKNVDLNVSCKKKHSNKQKIDKTRLIQNSIDNMLLRLLGASNYSKPKIKWKRLQLANTDICLNRLTLISCQQIKFS